SFILATWIPDRPKLVALIISYLEGVCLIVQNTFLVYCFTLEYHQEQSDRISLFSIFFTVGFSVVELIEIYFIGSSSSILVKEAQRTMTLIHKCMWMNNDDRLNSSVKTFLIDEGFFTIESSNSEEEETVTLFAEKNESSSRSHIYFD
ncbi:hypothetical protein Bhyg_11383, partial [Pseudolycoriella hygida]